MTLSFPAVDFRMCTFKLNEKTIATAYVGNHPNSSMVGAVDTDILLDMSRHYDWPAYVHFMLPQDLAKQERLIVRRLILAVAKENKARIVSFHPGANKDTPWQTP